MLNKNSIIRRASHIQSHFAKRKGNRFEPCSKHHLPYPLNMEVRRQGIKLIFRKPLYQQERLGRLASFQKGAFAEHGTGSLQRNSSPLASDASKHQRIIIPPLAFQAWMLPDRQDAGSICLRGTIQNHLVGETLKPNKGSIGLAPGSVGPRAPAGHARGCGVGQLPGELALSFGF